MLDGWLTTVLRDSAATGLECSLLLFDIDYFKSVNDAYGHARGDEVLRAVVARARGLARQEDLLFRYGGDEFVLLLPGTGSEEAYAAGRRLVEAFRATPFPGRPPLSLTISLGVATYPREAADPVGLLGVADRRNRLAKQRG